MYDFRISVALLPFGYTFSTRIESMRDLLYLAATQWGLGLLVLFVIDADNYVNGLVNYAFGYVAFISIYEIGYLVNDAWDAKRTNDGRGRFDGSVTFVFLILFLATRLLVWTFITTSFLSGDATFWFASNIALMVVFIAHNIIRDPALRYATFSQLALLRFSLPLVFSAPSQAFEEIIIVSFLHYLYFRGFTYLDSKNLLSIPKRKESDFGLRHTIMMLPIVSCLYLAADSILYPAAWLYTATTYLAYHCLSRQNK